MYKTQPLMNTDSRWQLWLRVALPFLVFVIAGSLALIMFMSSAYQRRSRQEFAELAATNADFIRAAHIPTTDRFAGYLSRVLGVAVHFGNPPVVGPERESVTVPLDSGQSLTLVREASSLTTLLVRPASLGVLGAFWGLSLALAWSINRAVVRPYLESQRLAALGKMATALAHEIQNPVAAIRLHAQLLQPAPEAGLISGEAGTIESLVNQWMFLAKPEPPQKSTVPLAELLTETVRSLTPLANHAGVNIHLDTASAPSIQADARRLGQAFRNIILNAIQAMPAGGTLTIAARDGTIEFADTGPGFSPAARNRYAEMFYTEKEGGMGIGLNVTHEIIKAHGGRLAVSNRPAGGALVRITL